MKKVYVVTYYDAEWGNASDYVLGVFDNEPQAVELVDKVKSLKDFDADGSYIRINERELNSDKLCDKVLH